MRTTRKSWVALTAGMAGISLVATGCASSTDDDGTDEGSGTEEITLTVATFNEFGYEDLVTEYMDLNPGITVELKKAATANEARDNLNRLIPIGGVGVGV